MTDWDSTLQSWIKPASEAEESRRDKTEDEIRSALASYKQLPNASIRVFAQGSYKNRTNVRLLSDVDIAVEYQQGERVPTDAPVTATTQQSFSAKDLTKDELGLTETGESYDTNEFKDHVEAAMVDAFGRSAVIRGDKAIRIRNGNTTLPADVVPCFPLRRYDSKYDVHRGIRIFPDEGFSIDNFPQQHYDNGVAKNNATGRRYKRMVRAFKRMSYHLSDKDDEPVVPSFTVESMLYNVPNSMFGRGTYLDDFTAIAEHMWYQTYKEERCRDWVEVNDLKYLFRGTKTDSREPASDFCWNAWKMVGGS